MKIITRFNKGDKVWVMKNNRPTEEIITSIRVLVEYENINIFYRFGVADRVDFNEHIVYATKEDLINSL